MPEESNTSHEISQSNNMDWKRRGVQWRVDLGVLPCKPAHVDELRRAAADGRRRYAELRWRLLVDPHLMEDCQTQAQLNQDNPLSLDPVFAMVLWQEQSNTFWETRVGVKSAPAVVFVKDPSLEPVIYHGVNCLPSLPLLIL